MLAKDSIQHIMKPRSPKKLDDRNLRFTKNGTFQISVFSDLHFAENATLDSMTKRVMSHVLSREDVQLVVLNGDLISGEATDGDNSGHYLHEVVTPLVEMDIPWASTYGNHDSEINLNPMKDIYDHEIQYKNSLTRSMVTGPKAGVTNYYLPVYPHESSEDTPSLILWFFDSKGGHYATNRGINGLSGTRGDWVHEDVQFVPTYNHRPLTKSKQVVEWFINQNANLTAKYRKVIPSLAFYHIPAHAMFSYQEEEFDSKATPGINGEIVVSQGSGDTNYTGQDNQFMQALLNTTGLIATFSGHDHDNDWCFKWNGSIVEQELTGNGVNMCYGRHTGYGGYGDAARGGRQIFLDQRAMEDEIQTWIRLEDGTTSAAITLNATYGQDQYEEVARRMVQASRVSSTHEQSVLLPWVVLWSLTLVCFRVHLF
ncbi:uncharacterized protein N7482_001549 [Penicillium canariense]|uniref:Calcineurin-like phosphoesterase domain-containing protein n=1 Tax=Penicillium canariense TaxID=189055 RepID=A0A9W9IFU3_9EURO|nr:uncharacterized protein N7482_001549 [Penicillium canariense]KAJ5175672.1 hypothetical protein N7482_001549 [Penicillium canariense]